MLELASPRSQLLWFDPTVLSVKTGRWYSAADVLGDRTVITVGDLADGGYITEIRLTLLLDEK